MGKHTRTVKPIDIHCLNTRLRCLPFLRCLRSQTLYGLSWDLITLADAFSYEVTLLGRSSFLVLLTREFDVRLLFGLSDHHSRTFTR